MQRVLTEIRSETITPSHSCLIFSDRIRPGEILRIDSLCGYSAQTETNDNVFLGVEDGGRRVYIQAAAIDTATEGICARGPIYVGEGDRAFAYFPDADEGDVIELHLIGVISPRTSWQNREE
jgi:hypothetical protein